MLGIGPAPAHAANTVPLPDPALRSCVQNELQAHNISTELTDENLELLPSISCSATRDGTIANLAGLENLANADRVSLPATTVSNLTALTTLPKLTTLSLASTTLTDGSTLGQLTQLTSLHLDAPQLGNVDFLSELSHLRGLRLKVAATASMAPIAQLTDLATLYLTVKTPQLPELTLPLRLRMLGVEGTSLTTLNALPSADQVTTLVLDQTRNLVDLGGLERLSGLTSLYIGEGRFRDLHPLTALTSLTTLRANNGVVDDLSGLADLTQLTTLELANNDIGDLTPLAELINLRHIALSDNRISDVTALARVATDATVQLSGNRLRDLSPLPDGATVYALNQAALKAPAATVGVPFDLGLRAVDGTGLCPNYLQSTQCDAGRVSYPESGTYTGTAVSADGNFRVAVSQYAGPDRPFEATLRPEVAGAPLVGRVLSSSYPAWIPYPDTGSFRWYSGGKAIAGSLGAGRSYRLRTFDVGTRVHVCYTASRDGFITTTACSAPTLAIHSADIYATARPTIKRKRDGRLGVVLEGRFNANRWDPGVVFHYQWYRNGKRVRHYKGTTERGPVSIGFLTRRDVGARYKLRVKATKPGCRPVVVYSKTFRVKKSTLR